MTALKVQSLLKVLKFEWILQPNVSMIVIIPLIDLKSRFSQLHLLNELDSLMFIAQNVQD